MIYLSFYMLHISPGISTMILLSITDWNIFTFSFTTLIINEMQECRDWMEKMVLLWSEHLSDKIGLAYLSPFYILSVASILSVGILLGVWAILYGPYSISQTVLARLNLVNINFVVQGHIELSCKVRLNSVEPIFQYTRGYIRKETLHVISMSTSRWNFKTKKGFILITLAILNFTPKIAQLLLR